MELARWRVDLEQRDVRGGSLPTTWALTGCEVSVLPSVTSILLAPSTTCALVRMWPAWSMTKPEPVAVPPPPPPKGLNGEEDCGACWACMNATPGESCW